MKEDASRVVLHGLKADSNLPAEAFQEQLGFIERAADMLQTIGDQMVEFERELQRHDPATAAMFTPVVVTVEDMKKGISKVVVASMSGEEIAPRAASLLRSVSVMLQDMKNAQKVA